MTADERWLGALWPTVRSYLPEAPSTIVELGCGKFGGFVPRLRESGYEAVGIDPAAPNGEDYRQAEFERSELPGHLDGVIACTSLHHVADPDEVLNKLAAAIAPGGMVVVVEWDWERFDEATARWCFERLSESDIDSWLHRHRDQWAQTGQSWEAYFRGWVEHHGLHGARRLVHELDERFERVHCSREPYYFAELFETSEADELSAIESGRIRPGRIDYVGRATDPEQAPQPMR